MNNREIEIARRSMKKIEKLAEEYGDKTGSSILYGDWRKVYTDGIRRGIEMGIEEVPTCSDDQGNESCKDCIRRLLEELEAEDE